MRIRTKLALAFILLIVVGVMTVASYVILVVRRQVEDEAQQKLVADAGRIALTFSNLAPGTDLPRLTEALHRSSGYLVACYDSAGGLLLGAPMWQPIDFPPEVLDSLKAAPDGLSAYINPASEHYFAFARVAEQPLGVSVVRLAVPRAQSQALVTRIRWIIYTGMFIALGLVVVFSFSIARWISRPVNILRDRARQVAEGKWDGSLALARRDEFGDLADSLNRMAQRFRTDNAELQRLNEQQRQFYTDIAHEIRNPLHALMGSLELLDVPNLPPNEQERAQQTIRTQAHRLNRLFEDLLTLQKAEQDPNFLRLKPVRTDDLLAETEAAHRLDALRKGLVLHVESKPLTVRADRDRLAQVLDNLVSNAIKYTETGSVSVSVKLADGLAQFSVQDTGPGIAPEHLPRLFDRFYRTDTARSRDSGGTGLGLAVARRLVEAHSGTLTAESTAGQGTVFQFTVPLAPSGT